MKKATRELSRLKRFSVIPLQSMAITVMATFFSLRYAMTVSTEPRLPSMLVYQLLEMRVAVSVSLDVLWAWWKITNHRHVSFAH